MPRIVKPEGGRQQDLLVGSVAAEVSAQLQKKKTNQTTPPQKKKKRKNPELTLQYLLFCEISSVLKTALIIQECFNYS